MATCKYCGKWSGLFEDEHLDCASAHEMSLHGRPEAVPTGQAQPIAAGTPRDNVAMSRYRDGYFTARSINGLGILIKKIAVVFGCLLALAGLAYFGENKLASFMLVLMGAIAGGVGFILGILVQSAGQLLKAMFDVAVNGSHFMTDDQRAKVMSLE